MVRSESLRNDHRPGPRRDTNSRPGVLSFARLLPLSVAPSHTGCAWVIFFRGGGDRGHLGGDYGEK